MDLQRPDLIQVLLHVEAHCSVLILRNVQPVEYEIPSINESTHLESFGDRQMELSDLFWETNNQEVINNFGYDNLDLSRVVSANKEL